MAVRGSRNTGFTFDGGSLVRNLHSMNRRVDTYISAVVDYTARDAESKMRRNAPWTDRTGNARQGLTATSFHETGSGDHIIALYHRVPYGIWLEVAHSGRYQIIMPTVQSSGNDLMRRLNKLFLGLGRGGVSL